MLTFINYLGKISELTQILQIDFEDTHEIFLRYKMNQLIFIFIYERNLD